MKAKNFFWAIMITMIAVSCAKDEDPTDPSNRVPDPEGTIELNMHNENNGKTYMATYGIYIDNANNLNGGDSGSYRDYEIVDLGAMKGLGNITQFTMTGAGHSCALIPGHGYLVSKSSETPFGDGIYLVNITYRVYAVSWILSAYDTILGAKVRYQTPFNPYNLPLTIEEFKAADVTSKGWEIITQTYGNETSGERVYYIKYKDMCSHVVEQYGL